MDQPLITDRLIIGRLTDSDTDDLVDMIMHQALYAVIGDAPANRQAANSRVERWIAGSPVATSLWVNSVVRTRETEAVVGLCQATVSLRPSGRADDCSVAYLVDPDHHRQGIGSEMMSAFTDVLVAEVAPRTLTAHIAVGHTPSERIAVTLGLSVTDAVDDDGERIWTRSVW